MTFNTPVLPKKIKVAFLPVNVDVYIPNPLRYYHCQVFGHHEDYCTRKPICAKGIALMIATVKIQINASTAMVIIHFFSRDCPTWKKEKEIFKIKYEKSLTFPEARKTVEDQYTAPGKSYASITEGANVHVS